MRQIIDIYGKTLLELLTLGLLLTLLFSTVTDGKGNRGVLGIIRANLQTDETDYHAYTDFNIYKEESEKAEPVISYDASRTISVGTVKLTDYIEAYNRMGEQLPLKVISIRDPDGVELLDTYYPDTAEIELTRSGVYTIEASAVDDCNKETACWIRMPVNGWLDGGGI